MNARVNRVKMLTRSKLLTRCNHMQIESEHSLAYKPNHWNEMNCEMVLFAVKHCKLPFYMLL